MKCHSAIDPLESRYLFLFFFFFSMFTYIFYNVLENHREMFYSKAESLVE